MEYSAEQTEVIRMAENKFVQQVMPFRPTAFMFERLSVGLRFTSIIVVQKQMH